MKYIISFLLISLNIFLHASTSYPSIFSQQGTPLYQSSEIFIQLKRYDSLKEPINSYLIQVSKTMQVGISAETSNEKTEKKAYLKALRSLQKNHDKIVDLSIKELLTTINQNDYTTFLHLINSSLNLYKNKNSLNDKIMLYYGNNKHKGKSAILEKIINHDKDFEKVYPTVEYVSNDITPTSVLSDTDNNIILLSSPGCPYCVKAKALLNSEGVTYKEYSVDKPRGRKLYKKYHGTGVPILIIGDTILRGYSKKKILNAI